MSAAIRYSRKIFNEDRCAPALLWDREGMKFTNIPEANDAKRAAGHTLAHVLKLIAPFSGPGQSILDEQLVTESQQQGHECRTHIVSP